MKEAIVIPLAAIMLPMVLVPILVTLRNRQKRREWLSRERMRALELGLPAPAPEPALGAGAVVLIGAGVPVASVIAAFVTTMNLSESNPDYLSIIAIAWGCGMIVSTAAIISSLVLGVMLVRSHGASRAADALAVKPVYDPDAYDVVSSRG